MSGSRDPTSSSPSSSGSSFCSILVFFLFVFLNVNGAVSADPIPGNETVPAVIVFGDSIMDPGNNNNMKTIVKCNFSPYGRDFDGGIPTGRFSNGLIPPDILAERFGIKKLLPAYLDPNVKPEDLITGVSFATGGTGYDPLTAKLVAVISLTDQLELFKEYLEKINSRFGQDKSADILSRGMFLVCLGTDDIANTYFSTPFRISHYDINSYTDLTTNSASSFLQELYGLGARRIGVFSLPPIGCVPSQRTLRGGLNRQCSEESNQAAQLFNSKLLSLTVSLGKKLPGSKFVYLDIYNPVISIIQNLDKYGFEEGDKGCCGTGNIEVSVLCNPSQEAKSCKDASKYVFWDSYHPTETTYRTLLPFVFSDETLKKFF